ncbi:glycosyltransferase [Roseomonas sp. AR75]|uniref:glycosyltransferase n=1 Tax=Roseomonas sp. AR75 TaxID=2562311 RepID=UPI0010BFE129|nr:glycosyltransferase [Roseomonas sp. AR75]
MPADAPPPRPGAPEDTRPPLAEAEARRAAGDWRGAAAAYAAHLAARPQDWPVWIQHGHCVKEAGDPAGALASYRRAEAGLPDDADLQLQIGHALKLTGDLAGARAAYARALELDPVHGAAWQEVASLLGSTGAAAEPAGLSLLDDLRLVFDLSDLMSWFGSNRAPSGIQRVQMEIAAAALARDAAMAEVRLAVFRPQRGAWRELPPEAFRRLCALSRGGADAADSEWQATRAQVEAMLDAAPDMVFPDGAWLVNLGSAWWLAGYHQAVRAARARQGLRYAALVHDAGPIVIPEHSEPAVSARFARWFTALAGAADLVLAVSDSTRGDVTRLAEQALTGLPFPPVRLMRPDGVLPPLPAAAPHPREAELLGAPYVLCVGTIESRKDHLFVLNAWLALLRRHGDAVPPLVLVGRAGFNAAPALALLRRAPVLAGRVTWLDDVADDALARLYAGALFTIYHSQHEGWGLPVTEALAAGKVVLAPGHSGLLESGQGLALHHAPGSEPEFLDLVEKLLFQAGFREAAEARIAAGRRLRSWRAIAAELVETLRAVPPGAPATLPPPPLGTVHGIGESTAAQPSPAMLWSEMLREGAGWQVPEMWGCWTRPGRALLRLPLPAASGPLRLHLALRGPDAPREVALRVGRGARQVVQVAPDARPVVVLDLPEPGSVAEIVIEAQPAEEDAAPDIGIGAVAVMACAPEDLAARLGFLERLRFVWPEMASAR